MVMIMTVKVMVMVMVMAKVMDWAMAMVKVMDWVTVLDYETRHILVGTLPRTECSFGTLFHSALLKGVK